jgi:hypothetical protein
LPRLFDLFFSRSDDASQVDNPVRARLLSFVTIKSIATIRRTAKFLQFITIKTFLVPHFQRHLIALCVKSYGDYGAEKAVGFRDIPNQRVRPEITHLPMK